MNNSTLNLVMTILAILAAAFSYMKASTVSQQVSSLVAETQNNVLEIQSLAQSEREHEKNIRGVDTLQCATINNIIAVVRAFDGIQAVPEFLDCGSGTGD